MGVVREPDRVAVLQDRRPAVDRREALEQRANAAVACVGNRAQAGAVEGDLLVLGADTPRLRRLLALADPGDELMARGDGGHVRHVASHAHLGFVKRVGPPGARGWEASHTGPAALPQ